MHGAGIPDSKPSTAVAYPLSERSYFTSVTDVPKVTDITGGSDKLDGSEVVLVVARKGTGVLDGTDESGLVSSSTRAC